MGLWVLVDVAGAEAGEIEKELPLVAGGQFVFWSDELGEAKAADVFQSVKIAWLFNAETMDWVAFIPALGSVNYSLSPGSFLWIVSDAPQVIVIEPERLWDDLRIVDLGTLPSGGGSVVLTVESGETSFVVHARSTALGMNDAVFVYEIIGPDGTSVVVPQTLLQDFGTDAVQIPQVPSITLVPGEYTVFVSSTFSTTVSAVLKRKSAGTQFLDVAFWVATNSDDVDSEDDRVLLEGIYRQRGDEIFTSSDLMLGSFEWITAPQDVIDRSSLLTINFDETWDEAPLREVCLEMSNSLGADRRLHVVLIDDFLDSFGFSSGVLGIAMAIPGVTVFDGMSLSCVFVTAQSAFATLAENATTVWHEAAHLLGLYHTSESNGLTFDYIADTPECSIFTFDTNFDGLVDNLECPDGTNFMFHYPLDATAMTHGQGFVLENHPLFYPG